MFKKTTNKLKILNDPIFGFITIPNSLIFDVIEHPYFQRLRRITQMGLSNLVYPGANHTRFHHALGCMFLMQKAIYSLRIKKINISLEEENALCITILLHDIGHGPFSHALEHSIVNGISHEDISLKFMKKLNEEFSGKLNLAIEIFEGKYYRKFFYQLISSQLDIDRLDYLKRDSFYTGVTEGNISSNRLIAMMNVKDDELVIEEKGIYSVENFIIARRLMYWQVYFHKTSIVAENILVKIIKRAKELIKEGNELSSTKSLSFFLKNSVNSIKFNNKNLDLFSKIDDYDVLASIKQWIYHDDLVLSKLSKMIVNRELFNIEINNKPFTTNYIQKKYEKFGNKLNLSKDDLNYFVFFGMVKNQAYDTKKPINILSKTGELKDLVNASDQLNIKALSKPVLKYYCCYPKKYILQ